MKKILLLGLIFTTNIYAWTDNVSTGTPVKAIHVNELRNVINLKRQCYGLPNATWTDTPIVQGSTIIKAVHLTEIRAAINSLYTSCAAGACLNGSGAYQAANKTWTDSSLKGIPIKATHVNELRTVLDNVTCTPYTYDWLPSNWSACSGGSGTWNYGGWGGCSGGSGTWSYGGWGGCSATCGGGSQTRPASCIANGGSGVQYRSATCSFNPATGNQTRAVQCQRNDSVIVADSYCTNSKPAVAQACTPTNSAVCGPMATTSQACTPPAPNCGAPNDIQGCNTQACCDPNSNSINMCAGGTWVTTALGTWGNPPNPMAMAVLAVNSQNACNWDAGGSWQSPGVPRCHDGGGAGGNVNFITPCFGCMFQFVACSCR